jgi:hypothetical protein
MKVTLGCKLRDNLGNIWLAWQVSRHYKSPNKLVFSLCSIEKGMQGTCDEEGKNFWQAYDASIKTLEDVVGTPTNSRLKELAASNPPSSVWLAGPEENLF